MKLYASYFSLVYLFHRMVILVFNETNIAYQIAYIVSIHRNINIDNASEYIRYEKGQYTIHHMPSKTSIRHQRINEVHRQSIGHLFRSFSPDLSHVLQVLQDTTRNLGNSGVDTAGNGEMMLVNFLDTYFYMADLHIW